MNVSFGQAYILKCKDNKQLEQLFDNPRGGQYYKQSPNNSVDLKSNELLFIPREYVNEMEALANNISGTIPAFTLEERIQKTNECHEKILKAAKNNAIIIDLKA